METINDVIHDISQLKTDNLPLVELIVRLAEATEFQIQENRRLIDETTTSLSNLEAEVTNTEGEG